MEKFDIRLNELELKHSADNVELSAFHAFAQKEKPKKYITISSYDTYYSPIVKPKAFKLAGLEFIRFRQGTTPELTIKVKTKSTNNQSRIEVDLPLSPKKTTRYIVSAFLRLLGFDVNFTIYKECYIYYYEKVDLVYYIVKDKENGKTLRNIIEIEARKDVPVNSANEAWGYVKDMEAKLSVFDIKPKNRLKKSMWEMFRKK